MQKTSDIGIDLGNSKFSICVRGEGIVSCESSFLAYRGEYLSDATVIAFGDEAGEMFERSPQGITVVTPMREGIVVDCKVAGMILNRLAKKAGICRGWSKPRTLVAALYGSSDVEHKAFLDVAKSLNYGPTFVVHEPLAAANALGIDISSPYSNMVVDVGDGATEAIVVSLKETAWGNSMRFGGHHMDSMLIEYVRKHHHFSISRSQARLVKEHLAAANAIELSVGEIAVKGTSMHNQRPATKRIPLSDFSPVLRRAANIIADFVQDILTQVPPEVSADLIENGIYLCGGASQSSYVKECISERTLLDVKTTEMPHLTVVQGLNQMLNFTRFYA